MCGPALIRVTFLRLLLLNLCAFVPRVCALYVEHILARGMQALYRPALAFGHGLLNMDASSAIFLDGTGRGSRVYQEAKCHAGSDLPSVLDCHTMPLMLYLCHKA